MVGVMVMANANKAQSLFRCVYNTPKWNKEWVPTYSGDRFGKGLPKAITGRKGVITMDSTAETQNITLAINISTKKKKMLNPHSTKKLNLGPGGPYRPQLLDRKTSDLALSPAQPPSSPCAAGAAGASSALVSSGCPICRAPRDKVREPYSG